MSNSNIIVMTTAKAKSGSEQTIAQALSDVAEAGRAQPGCVDQRIYQSAEDPAITVNFEVWSSEEGREKFLAGPDVNKFAEAVSDAFAEPPQPVTYEEIG